MSGPALRDRFTPTSGQRATLATLGDALRAPATAPGLLLVAGAPGSGKSTALAALYQRIAGERGLAAGRVVDAGTEHSDARLLRALIAACDEEPAGRSGLELLTTLRAIFAARTDAGARPVLLIDGAEALTGSQLEVIRSLLTTIAGGADAVTPAIVLSGRPEIRERIRRRRPLAQRRTHDLDLAGPDRDDLARVINGGASQADLLLAAAARRAIAPLALAAFVCERTEGAPLDESRLRAILRALPMAEGANNATDDAVQTAMPFAPAGERDAGVRQLPLLQPAGDFAGAAAGGGDR